MTTHGGGRDAGDYPALLTAAAAAEADRLGYHDEVARGRAGRPLRGLGVAAVPGEERARPAGDRRRHAAGPGR